MPKDNLTALELNILQVAYYFKPFSYGFLIHNTIEASKEDKEKAIDNLVTKGYLFWRYEFNALDLISEKVRQRLIEEEVETE